MAVDGGRLDRDDRLPRDASAGLCKDAGKSSCRVRRCDGSSDRAPVAGLLSVVADPVRHVASRARSRR